MDSPILSTTTQPIHFDVKEAFKAHLSPATKHSKSSQLATLPKKSSEVVDAGQNVFWGRRFKNHWAVSLLSLGVMTLAPCLIIFTYTTLEFFGGSYSDAAAALLEVGAWRYGVMYGPRSSLTVFAAYNAWFLFQAALYTYLPAPLRTGQLTPAGHLLQYHTNGFSAWLLTTTLFVSLSITGIVDPAIIANNWGALIISSNICGLFLSTFAYAKAHLSPTHPDDVKITSSAIYNFYMGIELNPRLSKTWDFKLFTNGRPGIVAWTLIDLSFIAQQYAVHGHITLSILAATFLHSVYVVDFFINEDWYLRTIDIAHDHYGFYLAWGSLAWLPTMYTLQTQYLARYTVEMPKLVVAAIVAVGLGGYALFRSVNHQKDIVRSTGGDCEVWGKKAEVIVCSYITQDGKTHQSLLLCSGWWGLARHANYVGDLILSFAMCATCGSPFHHVLPWFYAVYMTVLLLHRCRRDEKRCQAKYGVKWDEYVKRVPWKLIPGLY